MTVFNCLSKPATCSSKKKYFLLKSAYMKIETRAKKMHEIDNKLELDYSSRKRKKRNCITILLYVLLFPFLMLLGSYKNPTVRVNNKLVDFNTYKFQNLIEMYINSLSNINDSDSLQDVDNQIKELLVTFYENREFNPTWTHHFGTSHQFRDYLNLLDSAKYYGFPFDYFYKEKIVQLEAEFENLDNKAEILNKRVDLELTTTFSALKLMIYLNRGIIEQDTSSTHMAFLETLPGILDNAILNNLSKGILSIQPNLVQHRDLLKSLPDFIDLKLSIKYTTPKFIDDNVLAKSLYYAGIIETIDSYSENNNSEAISKLQEKFQLPVNAVLNDTTHKALVSLLEYRYYQTCLNLHRLKKLGHSGENYLFVNIPGFKLHVVESNQEKEAFNVIVGKKKTPTPTLSSSIEKVVANPYWTVPRSIVNNEMIHKIRKDSTYLSRNGFFVINNYEESVDASKIDWNKEDPLGNKYWLRQKNSRSNALGQVKFLFPNNYSVYLHDTQAKGLFKRNTRTFSHGCVRLENPDKLAQYITNKYYTSEEEVNIKNLISDDDRYVIELSEKIDIHIQYITCSGNENSGIIFYNDVYNLDDKEIKAIFLKSHEI